MLTRGRTRVKAGPSPTLTRTLRWLPAVAWMGGIFYLSQQSAPLGATPDAAGAIAAHLVLFAGLAVLLFWAVAGAAPSHAEAPIWVAAGLAFALAVLYGAADEIHQSFVPTRVASEADLVLDAAGAVIGVSLAVTAPKLLRMHRSRRRRHGRNP